MCDHRDNENRTTATSIGTPSGVYMFDIHSIFFFLRFYSLPYIYQYDLCLGMTQSLPSIK